MSAIPLLEHLAKLNPFLSISNMPDKSANVLSVFHIFRTQLSWFYMLHPFHERLPNSCSPCYLAASTWQRHEVTQKMVWKSPSLALSSNNNEEN